MSALFRAAGHPINPEEWAILLVLWKQSPQTPGALADVTIKDRTTVTRLIDAMVRKGLVIRTEDPDDRRRSIVAVSVHGHAVKSELIGIAQGLIDRTLGGIPREDIDTTTRTLQAMTQNLLTSSDSKKNTRE
ncbi:MULTISPECIES: MarR family winged helix-turn-helix transcriptional regulator [Roseobacteraceae]|uniref:HTH-type transcriptional regulator MhqR n=1 Tax=Pseudosulfitobacter pseudonitzschiae TaxID=1402135 RepID=A0A221JX70_9RHOB|nr:MULTISPECIES: MarR family winged helix-turn-helix transcriptional regulator [Roseobacteraceae]ASM71316.1 HTH-type transcriptional regulator MhqR [Pseudosulfitobacter pseudonitzschiae]